VTGKIQEADGRRQEAAKAGCPDEMARSFCLPPAVCRLPTSSRGFTLLELMIVISIIIILAAIALPQYRRTITAAREAVLREDLFKLRSLLDQYGADKGKLPQSLDDLVNDRYMREVPVDPITGEKDWTPEMGEDPNSTSGEQGVVNVHSASSDTSSEGNVYSEW